MGGFAENVRVFGFGGGDMTEGGEELRVYGRAACDCLTILRPTDLSISCQTET